MSELDSNATPAVSRAGKPLPPTPPIVSDGATVPHTLAPAAPTTPSMPPARLVVIFRGRVQGVGFRKTTAYLARDFRVTGYVRNEPDGTVRLDIEGESDELQRFWQLIENRMRLFIDHRDIFTPHPRGKFENFHVAHHPNE